MSETSNQLKTSDETAARLAELVSRAREATACKVCGNIVGDDGARAAKSLQEAGVTCENFDDLDDWKVYGIMVQDLPW